MRQLLTYDFIYLVDSLHMLGELLYYRLLVTPKLPIKQVISLNVKCAGCFSGIYASFMACVRISWAIFQLAVARCLVLHWWRRRYKLGGNKRRVFLFLKEFSMQGIWHAKWRRVKSVYMDVCLTVNDRMEALGLVEITSGSFDDELFAFWCDDPAFK